jgi:uncharacterized coiled-coil protein SlyX
MREASSRRLMEALWEAGAKVRAFDPQAREETHRLYGDRDDLVLCEHAYDALEGADVLAIVTEWKAFRSPDFARIRAALKRAGHFRWAQSLRSGSRGRGRVWPITASAVAAVCSVPMNHERLRTTRLTELEVKLTFIDDTCRRWHRPMPISPCALPAGALLRDLRSELSTMRTGRHDPHSEPPPPHY